MNHDPACDCFVCREGEGALLQWQAEQMATSGFFVHGVSDPNMPLGVNHHTHGLEITFGHPDLQIVLPVPPRDYMGIFWGVVDMIKQGQNFKAGDRVEVLPGLKVLFAEAQESGRQVLRIILPDPDGNLDIGVIKGGYERQYDDLPPQPQPEIATGKAADPS